MSKKILVVDDEKDIVEVISMYLEREDYEPLAAYDGQEALQKIILQQPDLVVLDIMMPKLDGHSLNIKLKENPETKDIPVIVMTGKGHLREIITARKDVTIVDYIEKPFQMNELLEKIKNVFEKKNE
ncbi:MAG: two-component system response regulator [Elusimicrobia bacterium CG06_land_8_20_14_3_00_38_11]|nr:MAG: two-component system response regulator [Elusimicrobia bacterium CG06_land_8_20_14_3_00_38_11]